MNKMKIWLLLAAIVAVAVGLFVYWSPKKDRSINEPQQSQENSSGVITMTVTGKFSR